MGRIPVVAREAPSQVVLVELTRWAELVVLRVERVELQGVLWGAAEQVAQPAVVRQWVLHARQQRALKTLWISRFESLRLAPGCWATCPPVT